MGQVTILDCGQGLNLDALASELKPGQAADATNMRFGEGFAERHGGQAAAFTTPAVTPYFITTYATATARFQVHCGIADVYVDDGTTQTKITRYTDGKNIAGLTWAVNAITVTTDVAHGFSGGEAVTLYGAIPTGYNGTYTVASTPSATAFTVALASDPGTATNLGMYSYNVEADFTGAIDDRWTGFAFNGVLILNNPVDGLYYWNGDVTTRLRRLPGWKTGWKADAAFPSENFIVLLAPTTTGAKQPHTALWGSAADPGAVPTYWTAAATNDAGDTPKAAQMPGLLVDGLAYGGVWYAYKQDSCFAGRYIGGNDVFDVEQMPSSLNGLLARGCIVNTDVGQVFLTMDRDVKIHQGGEARSIADGRVRRWLKTNIDSTNKGRCFLAVNPLFKEVWVCIPTSGQSTCNVALTWNWVSDSWGKRTLTNVTYGTAGLVASGVASSGAPQMLLCASTPRIILVDSGTTDFGSSFTGEIVFKGLTFGNPDTIKTPHRSRWHAEATAGTALTVTHGTCMTANGTPSYGSGITYTVGTDDWANGFANGGKYIATKISATAAYRIRSGQVDFIDEGVH